MIAQAIRRSLKSEGSKMNMQLGPEATASQMFHKMDSIFGSLNREQNVMEEFYRTRTKSPMTSKSLTSFNSSVGYGPLVRRFISPKVH